MKRYFAKAIILVGLLSSAYSSAMISPHTKSAFIFTSGSSFVGGCMAGFRPSIKNISCGSLIALFSYFLSTLTSNYGLQENDKIPAEKRTMLDTVTIPFARKFSPGLLKLSSFLSFSAGVTTGIVVRTALWPFFALIGK